MSNFVGTAFPQNASIGQDFYHVSQGLSYRFLGGGPSSDPLNWIIFDGSVASDPDTTGWGAKQRGAKWYNFSDQNFKGWNGDSIVLLG